ncbi:FixH family protein [Paludibacterium paludis]|uniref:Membrane protein n=1 Tax=Paludibacterium paludis TaxID=1225769 RepID=A0A918U776_9NEIS|nr:FixH family protein [Paludibacterium paludis]GGY03417.1 membrane protein [Paludibacterium paludis]
MQEQQTIKPWYRHRWPWLLMIGPLASIAVGAAFLRAAIVTDDGLVVDDYYKRGKEINMELKRDHMADSLKIAGHAEFSADMRSVRVEVSAEKPLPDTLSLSLVHPTQDDYDIISVLTRVDGNVYQGVLAPITHPARHWYVLLEDPAKTWRRQGEWVPSGGRRVKLDGARLEPAA